MGSALATAGSFVGTKIALLVISGSIGVVFSCGAVWALIRAMRAALVAVRSRAIPRVLRRWVNFRTRKLPVIASGAALVPANLVRLVGVVEGDARTMAEFSGASTVVARNEVGECGGGSVRRSVAAQDFTVRLEDGQTVKVLAEDAAQRRHLVLLDSSPDRWTGTGDRRGWFCESRLLPGDRVEVIGEASRRIDRHAQRIGDRQPALSWTLLAGRTSLALSFHTRATDRRGPH